jgi:hypothetical protein
MTVKDLIRELQKYPSNMLIYKNDSEYEVWYEASELTIRKDEWVWDGPNHIVQDVLVIE